MTDVALNAVPRFLTAQPRWLLWRRKVTVDRETGAVRSTKVPISFRTGRPADVTDPRSCAGFDEVAAALVCTPKAWDGPGFVLGIIEPQGEVVIGLDLDTCIDADEVVASWAIPFLQAMPTYAEVSPSLTGIKLFARLRLADLPAARRLLDIAEADRDQARTITFGERRDNAHASGAQLFLMARYFTVTGQHWSSAPEDVMLLDLAQIARLAALFGPKQQRPGVGGRREAGTDPLPVVPDSPALQDRLHLAFQRSPELQARWAGDTTGMLDTTGSAFDLAIVARLRFHGFTEPEACLLASECPHGTGSKHPQGSRHWRRCWERTRPDAEGAADTAGEPDVDWPWGDTETSGETPDTSPDLAVLHLNRRPAPLLPLDVFGPDWRDWIEVTADAAACPPDYVALPLLAAASALIGNARWAQAWPGWHEPPHLWVGAVGDSGTGKSPGSDLMMRDVLPELERRMLADFPDRLRDWQSAAEAHEAATERWKADVREAGKKGYAPPLPPPEAPPEPQGPRLRLNDITIERVATLLAAAAPKGLLVTRDELVGWIAGMATYNDAGRAFWLECYGGRPYRVERQKHPAGIAVERLVVAVSGSTQPERLARLLTLDADDGLAARIIWAWPEPLQFRASHHAPRAPWAITALDRLRLLDLTPGAADQPPEPLMVPLVVEARAYMEVFAREMQQRQEAASGLLRSALGKARGLALRLSLGLEYLWWCAADGFFEPPATISAEAFEAATKLVGNYFMPMAERVYGDAALPAAERNATTLAKWIVKTRPAELHIRTVRRQARLPGLRETGAVQQAATELLEQGWLLPPVASGNPGRPRAAYPINPSLWDALP